MSASEIIFLDGDRAKDLIEKQCSYGPRYPGSDGHKNVSKFLIDFLRANSDTVLVFKHDTVSPISKKDVTLTNILARYNPQIADRFILLAHWDTREVADKDSQKSQRDKPIIGANDGASGVAVLLTIAEILKKNPLQNIGVDILLVDGEDMGVEGDIDSWGIGTQFFAKEIPAPVPEFGICLDMVGDYSPEFLVEYYSYQVAPNIVSDVWSLANSIGYDEFKLNIGQPIIDDHYMLYKYGGVPTINIIDFNYPDASTNYWHTHNDIPKHCSSKTLGTVGTVVATYIYIRDTK